MTEPQKESVLRDHLAQNLDLIEPGLHLVKVEYPVNNLHGADGSIDILALDASGDFVVIELKRSTQASRQALQELEKYVGLLAQSRGLRVDQLRCILLSTTWHELAVPFARFIGHVDFHVEGRVLEVGADGLPASSAPVVLPTISSGITACPLHLDLLFREAQERDAALQSARDVLEDLGVHDFVVISMTYAGSSDRVMFPFSVYVVFAQFSDALCEHVRGRFPEDAADEPEKPHWWYEQLVQGKVMEAVAVEKSVEISTPDRFKTATEWDVDAVNGYGRFDDPLIWSDDAVLGMVSGFDGSFSTSLTRRTRPAQRAAWIKLRSDLDRCLRGAQGWRGVVNAWLDEREGEPETGVLVYVYAPNDILYALEHLARTGKPSHMPNLFMLAQSDTVERVVGGRLHSDGSTRVESIDQTLGAKFDDFMEYAFAQASGELAKVDEELCHRHGLTYQAIESTSSVGSNALSEGVRLSVTPEGRLTRDALTAADLIDDAATFVAANEGYLNELQETFQEYVWRAE